MSAGLCCLKGLLEGSSCHSHPSLKQPLDGIGNMKLLDWIFSNLDDSMILPSSSEYTMVHTSLSKVSMCFRIFWCYVIAIRSYLFFLPRCSASISTRTSEKYLPGHLDATYCTNALNKFIIRHGFEIFDKVLSPFRLTFISVTYHFWCCLMALQVYLQKPRI